MSTASFAASLPFILRWEGGYVNHPAAPGGATSRGVTQKVCDAWRRGKGRPAQDVRRLGDADRAVAGAAARRFPLPARRTWP